MINLLTFTAVLKCSQHKFLLPGLRISNNTAAQKHHEKNNETWPKQTTGSGSPFPSCQLPFGSWQCKNLKIVCKLKAKCELILIKHMRHSHRTLSWSWKVPWRGVRGVAALLANNSCTILGDLMKEVQTKPQSQLQAELCVGQGKGHIAERGLRPHMLDCVCAYVCVHVCSSVSAKYTQNLPKCANDIVHCQREAPLPLSLCLSCSPLFCSSLSACSLLLGGEL